MEKHTKCKMFTLPKTNNDHSKVTHTHITTLILNVYYTMILAEKRASE